MGGGHGGWVVGMVGRVVDGWWAWLVWWWMSFAGMVGEVVDGWWA